MVAKKIKKNNVKKSNLEDHHKIAIAGIIIFIFVLFFLMSIVYNFTKEIRLQDETLISNQNNEELNDNSNNKNNNIEINNKYEINSLKDGTKYIINPKDISTGLPVKGGIGVEKGIPALALKNINFVSVSEADKWIEDNELVLAINYKGEKRVYPLQIMVWHELANDVIQEDPILITYCPLCGSGIAYERTIVVNGEKIETRFGTSGKLYNSNLIMYDEDTDTYWQQIGGLAIIGELTGQELTLIDLDTVVWRDYKSLNSDAKVLSQETGMNRDYGRDPYGSYYEDSILFFPVDKTDNRIHNKDVIFGIEVNGEYGAYREIDLIKERNIIDNLGGIEIELIRNEDTTITIINKENGDIIPKERDFWFSWYAFHPNTKLYGIDERQI